MVLRAMIDFDQNSMVGPGGGGGVSVMAPMDNSARARFRSRLHNKGGLVQPPSPGNDYMGASSPRSIYGIGELNRRITDLKVDNPSLSPPQTFTETSPKHLLDLGQNYAGNNPGCHYQTSTMMQYNQNMNPRRDSNNSTTSSSYYSMKSCDVSRRSSQQSYTNSINTIRNNNYINYDPQFYDPISAGSSRRSSQMSNNDMNNYGPPSSQLLSSHLARLQRQSNSNLYPYHTSYLNQNQYHPYGNNAQGVMSNNYNVAQFNHQIPTSLSPPSSDRRMSEPISNFSKTSENQNARNAQMTRRPRSTTPTKSLETLLDGGSSSNDKKSKPKEKDCNSPVKPHPNETVVLDVLKTNEKIENCDELVIPDEMVMYLNQVVDDATELTNDSKIKRDFEGEMSSSISIEKIKEEDLFSLLTEADVKTEDNAYVAGEDLEINNNKNSKSENDNKTNSSSNQRQQVLCKS